LVLSEAGAEKMKKTLVLAVLGIILCGPAMAGDVEAVFNCIDKVAPEGDVPDAPLPPNRQTCIGFIADPCEAAGGDWHTCYMRETKAWLGAIAVVQADAKSSYGKKHAAAFKAGTGALLQNAIALCRAAGATSAWGRSAMDEGRDPVTFDGGHHCVSQSVAQQALIVLAERVGI
jgi:hypothetical protein